MKYPEKEQRAQLAATPTLDVVPLRRFITTRVLQRERWRRGRAGGEGGRWRGEGLLLQIERAHEASKQRHKANKKKQTNKVGGVYRADRQTEKTTGSGESRGHSRSGGRTPGRRSSPPLTVARHERRSQ